MKLYGKELDRELAKRRKAKEERIKQRLSARMVAKSKGIKPTDVLAYEYGYDVCPHEEYEDMLGGVPIPKLIFRQCKKCGKVDEKSMEKVCEDNLERTYKVMKRITGKRSKGKI